MVGIYDNNHCNSKLVGLIAEELPIIMIDMGHLETISTKKEKY